ncbi:MAG: cysteine desulfurase family protein [Coriobacteriales bacterium]|jgi:cysteine desulfurase
MTPMSSSEEDRHPAEHASPACPQDASRISYLDNAATTRPRKEVVEVISNTLVQVYGNASSVHAPGKRAKQVLEESRAIVADALDVDPDEIIFTSGGTESNNLAITGACRARGKDAGQIIVSTLEHPSVTRTVRGLKREGWEVSYLEAEGGDLDLDSLRGHLETPTSIVTVMAVQNELGYRFPIGEVCHLRDQLEPEALVHSDIVQAFGKIPTPLREWGVDLASISSHKIGGPKGVGALYVKRGTKMFTTAFGGGQERGLRSGTEPVFLIAGFAEAVRCTFADIESKERRVRKLWDKLASRLTQEVPDVIINSREDGSPYIFNFSIPGMRSREALEYLSERGVFVSHGSACENNENTVEPGTWRPKHPQALQAAGISKKQANWTIRVSFEYESTEEDVDTFVDILEQYLQESGAKGR